jgi:hypothetical protein
MQLGFRVNRASCEAVVGVGVLRGQADQRVAPHERVPAKYTKMVLDGVLHDLARACFIAAGDSAKLSQRLSKR